MEVEWCNIYIYIYIERVVGCADKVLANCWPEEEENTRAGLLNYVMAVHYCVTYIQHSEPFMQNLLEA